ncbi:nucleotidyltransferase domain-containing protein [Trueperella pecoris]|uniref:Nucleotidyltransferase domain-containing protein n=1 Tax=Trueperella pecoris TaxID=2733571 RepID=A0A7M1R0T5_9ACTO|nr:nucleotidyltransferase domain-containing protein [Trueperella pecoris]QOR47324.1 nucleotidyltransferase domain-containing protein [Trueperella pecoris]
MTIEAFLDREEISRAAKRRGVFRLQVFGSAVRGGFSERSDIDFLVDFLPNREDPFEDYVGLRKDLEEITRRDVDLVVERAVRNPFFKESVLESAEDVYVADI